MGPGTGLEWKGTPPGALGAGNGRAAQGPPITADLDLGSAGQGVAPEDKAILTRAPPPRTRGHW